MKASKIAINARLFPIGEAKNAGLPRAYLTQKRNPYLVIGQLPDQRRIVINERENHTPGVFSGWLVPKEAAEKRLSPDSIDKVVVKFSRSEVFDFWHKLEVSLLTQLDPLVPQIPIILYQGKASVTLHSSITNGLLWREAPYFVMTKFSGQTFDKLAESWQNRPPHRHELIKLLNTFNGLARLLAKVHGENGEPVKIVHRDLKPLNLINEIDQPRVLDFGSANYLNGRIKRRDVGTAGFFPPEFLAAGLTEDDPRIDTYGLAATFITVLSGNRPLMYPGVTSPWLGNSSQENAERYARQVWEHREKTAAELIKASNFPDDLKETPLAQFLFTMVHPNRELRPARMNEIADKFSGFREELTAV